MKKFLLLALVFNSSLAIAQSSDYCFQSKGNWTPLHEAVCFDSQMTFEMGAFFASKFDKNYKQPMYWALNKERQLKVVDSAFVMKEMTGSMQGITRVSFNITNNLRISVATLPFDKNSFDKAQIVLIAKTDGECQLVCDGIFNKVKIKAEDNISMYAVEPIAKTIIVNDKKMDLTITLYYQDGMTLKYINVNNIMIKI